jgi:hypothetical protein
MYYEPGTSHHGLPFDPFKSCVEFVWNMATHDLREGTSFRRVSSARRSTSSK